MKFACRKDLQETGAEVYQKLLQSTRDPWIYTIAGLSGKKYPNNGMFSVRCNIAGQLFTVYLCENGTTSVYAQVEGGSFSRIVPELSEEFGCVMDETIYTLYQYFEDLSEND